MNALDLISLVAELARSPLQEHHAILTNRTTWFGKIVNYFLPQSGVDIHATIYKIQSLIEKDPSVLKQPTFVKDAIHLTNKLDNYVYALLEKDPNPENKKLLSFIFSLEGCIFTRISGDQTKNLEVISSIKSRLVLENIIPYLIGTNFSQNMTLATACCEYIEENRLINCLKESEKILPLLNAGCLAKNDLVVKTVWEIICLNKSFAVFKTDEKITSSLDYLINKKEYTNQTLIVGDWQKSQEILVHREILSQRNRYFHALFQANFSEESQDIITLKNQNTANLLSIDYEGLLYILRYIYTGNVDVPLDLCLKVSHLADLYLEPDLKKTCDKKKWHQAVLSLKRKNLIGKFQSSNYNKFFYLIHEIYTGKTDMSSMITLNDLQLEKLQDIDYQAVLYLLHYIYTNDEDVPLYLCSDVSRLADNYSEPDLKKACDHKKLFSCL